MPEFDIVSIGECMVELYSNRPLFDAETFSKSCGGDTLNVLVAAARLGSVTGFITRVGEDQFAPFLLQEWLNERIDLSLVKVIPERKNGVYFISEFEGGGFNYAEYREDSAASTLSVDDLATEYLVAGRYMHVSGVGQAISESCGGAVFEACRLVKANKSGQVSYDPQLRSGIWSAEAARQGFEELLPYIDVLFLKHPLESTALTGISDPEMLIRALWQQGIRVVVLKLGKQGCIVGERHSRDIAEVRPLKAGKVYDTFGSGDTFCGAFLHGLARGYDVHKAAWLGNIAAGLKTPGLGAISSLPEHNDVYQVFEAA
ncbi:MAG TPA: sugar kinase [Candidatus Aquicultor sp.]|jgi:2-dehydro-3-deoxygluconokinase